MIDREKVINGLEHCAEDGCKGCPYNEDCEMEDGFTAIARDALALLKAQEPRVMTLEEANTFEVVWVEDRSMNTVFPCLAKNNMNDSKLYKHGIQWRVWSARPTEEQREGVKWDG